MKRLGGTLSIHSPMTLVGSSARAGNVVEIGRGDFQINTRPAHCNRIQIGESS